VPFFLEVAANELGVARKNQRQYGKLF